MDMSEFYDYNLTRIIPDNISLVNCMMSAVICKNKIIDYIA